MNKSLTTSKFQIKKSIVTRFTKAATGRAPLSTSSVDTTFIFPAPRH